MLKPALGWSVTNAPTKYYGHFQGHANGHPRRIHRF
jgi:hypothetical protein